MSLSMWPPITVTVSSNLSGFQRASRFRLDTFPRVDDSWTNEYGGMIKMSVWKMQGGEMSMEG
eukprot:1338013-Amorphochlora_amoeboformis.AAC.1